MRILLLGADGQIGWELRRTLAPLGELMPYTRETLDLGDRAGLRRTIRQAAPAVIINAAAYTHVDAAEREPQLADRINHLAPGDIAAEAERAGALLVHFSTDYVFDGASSAAYREADATGPLNTYGRSKLAGDEAILATAASAYIFRVAWVYGSRGKNFLRTIRRLAIGPDDLRVVNDQRGTPTWCRSVADAVTAAVVRVMSDRAAGAEPPPAGVYHMSAPDSATWFEFASEVVAEMASRGVGVPRVVPVTSAEHPTPARRPAFTVLNSDRLLDGFGLQLRPWREQLAACIAEENRPVRG